MQFIPKKKVPDFYRPNHFTKNKQYFGAQAKKLIAYFAATVLGTILTVCSCAVFLLFLGIYQRCKENFLDKQKKK